MADLSGVRVMAGISGLELFGHERGNIEVLKALRSAGAEVLVGVNAREDGGAVGDELRALRFETILIPFGPPWSMRFLAHEPSLVITRPMAVLRSSRRFLRALREFRPTLVHLGSALVYSDLSLALSRDPVALIYRMGDAPPIDSRFNLMLWKAAIRRATRVVANSDFVRKAAVGAGVDGKKVDLIYNVPPTSATVERAISDTDAKDRIVYAGAVAGHKGLMELIDAFGAVSARFPSIELDIIGQSRWDGEFRAQLVRRVSELGLENRVVLRGHVKDPSGFLRRALLHVAPSVWEEPGANVVLEAKREGTPSVVFRSGSLPEMVHHMVDGFICEDKSARALALGIEWSLLDRDRLAEMGRAARRDFIERFGPQRFVNQWVESYLSAIRRKVLPSDD